MDLNMQLKKTTPIVIASLLIFKPCVSIASYIPEGLVRDERAIKWGVPSEIYFESIGENGKRICKFVSEIKVDKASSDELKGWTSQEDTGNQKKAKVTGQPKAKKDPKKKT